MTGPLPRYGVELSEDGMYRVVDRVEDGRLVIELSMPDMAQHAARLLNADAERAGEVAR